jgi:acyl-CoA reductase-like NAD-dependent aldehyde dehydrogenase
VNGREDPLAMYIYSGDDATTEGILSATTSGGVCVNDCIMHIGGPQVRYNGC